jgi:type II secretory pathway component GspD/PulD (secretin)
VATQQAYIADLEPVVGDNAVAFNPIPAYVPTGSTLDVEATISADRRYVTLTVRPQVATLNGFTQYATTVFEANDEGEPITGSGFIQLPNVTIQQLETTVSVPDGGTLLLGGQRLSGEVEREMGVPLLNKIPILNRGFTNRGMVRDEETLLILIKPKIIIQREEEERQFPD